MIVVFLGLLIAELFHAVLKLCGLPLERLILASELVVVVFEVRVASQLLLVGGDHAIFDRRLAKLGCRS